MATIYKRRRVWYVDYTDPRTARRVQRSLGVRTKAAAEAARARVELELVEGRTPNVEVATLGRLLEAYLKYCEPRNGSQTMVDKRRQPYRKNVVKKFLDF